MKRLIKQLKTLLKLPNKSKMPSPPIQIKKNQKNKKRSPDLIFSVKQHSKNYYEVTSDSFAKLKGLGVSEDQALDDLLKKVNSHIDSFVRNTLLVSIHHSEISNKFSKTVKKLKQTRIKKKPWFKKIITLKEKQPDFQISLFLKDSLSTEALLNNVVQKEFGKNMFHTLSKLDNQTSFSKINNDLNHDIRLTDDNKIILKKGSNNEQIPFHLLLDSKGSSPDSDDLFAFGFSVNLN